MWFLWLLLACIPIGLTLWALTDAASRPAWVWAMAGRTQVVWIGCIVAGVLVVPVGLAISGYYLVRLRPALARIEGGRLDP